MERQESPHLTGLLTASRIERLTSVALQPLAALQILIRFKNSEGGS